MNNHAELISTGAELLSGRTVNRHAQVLGDHLARIGLRLTRDTTVPDDYDGILDAVRSAWQRVRYVFVSGGLGPTSDDVTRDAVAGLLGRRVVMDPESLDYVRERFRQYGRKLTPAGERQALIVENAAALKNRVGAAPGERIEADDHVLFMLPGPPAEFLAVLTDHVMPWLADHVDKSLRVQERIYMVTGLGESDIVNRFEERGFPPAGTEIAYCAAPARVEIRLTAQGPTANATLDALDRELRGSLGDHIFAFERAGIEQVIGRLLLEKKQTLATAESCTGGELGQIITRVSGSSAYYLGGIIAYSNDVKMRELDIDPALLEQEGAVSEPVARAMATEVREQFKADYGIGITGVAGPTGGTADKPVGLVFIAVAGASGCAARRCLFPGTRDTIREWSAVTALDMLRRAIREIKG